MYCLQDTTMLCWRKSVGFRVHAKADLNIHPLSYDGYQMSGDRQLFGQCHPMRIPYDWIMSTSNSIYILWCQQALFSCLVVLIARC